MMSVLVTFFRCVGEAVRAKGLKAVARLLPCGEAIYEIATEAHASFRRARLESTLHEGLDALRSLDAAAIAPVAQEAAGGLPDLTDEQRAGMVLFLTLVAERARREPVSVAAPETLVTVLPAALPRFQPGDQPHPERGLQLIALVGSGSLGEVWRAADPLEPESTPVVLKLCTEAAGAARLRQAEPYLDRVIREGHTPGIARLRRVALELPVPCLEYDEAQGRELTSVIRESAGLSPHARASQATAILLQLANILTPLHQLRPPIVHGDLKPSNILIQESGALTITDLGIGQITSALAQAQKNALSPQAQLAIQLRGAYSPLYTSRQQKSGNSPDPRDDVFALGVLWFQLLTGDPSHRPGAEWREEVQETGAGGAMIRLLHRCWREPTQRPTDAAALAHEIRHLPVPRDCALEVPEPLPNALAPVEHGNFVLPHLPRLLGVFGRETYRPLQEEAMLALLQGQRPLVVLPTGGGKSLCYQLPALGLHRYGLGLTVVISPLQALMEDQVLDLQDSGLTFATFLNANLSPACRARRLEQVRQGTIGLLYLSPESLRSRSIQALFRERPPVCWVIDEAHCISQWGHDFRPDYCYVPKFIRELSGEKAPPLLGLFTATATAAVREDLLALFARHGLPLGPSVIGDATRPNLTYQVVRVGSDKDSAVLRQLSAALSAQSGCALVYTTTRREAERLAKLIQGANIECRHYHGGMPQIEKRKVLAQFKDGTLRVVAATSAFGMGINRGDVRAVIHHCMSSSLEAYTQETGRAGRDGQPATCTLLFHEQDADLLFGMRARMFLGEEELRNIFLATRALRDRARDRTESKDHPESKIDAWFRVSEAEISREAVLTQEQDLGPEQRDTRLRVAIHMLEELEMLERGANLFSRMAFDLVLPDLADAEQVIRENLGGRDDCAQYLRLVRTMYTLHAKRGSGEWPLPADLLGAAAGVEPQSLFEAVQQLALLGVCHVETPLTVSFVRGGKTDARRMHGRFREIEEKLAAQLVELIRQHGKQIHLRGLVARLDPDRKLKLRAAMVRDLIEAWVAQQWLQAKSVAPEVFVFENIEGVAEPLARHRKIATAVLDALYAESGSVRGRQHVKTELGRLLQSAQHIDPDARPRDLELVLGWLHDRDILKIDEGLSLVRQAMELRVHKGQRLDAISRQYPYIVYPRYQDQNRRTHLMVHYGRLGCQNQSEANRLVEDYFRLPRQEFDALRFPEDAESLSRPILPGDEARIFADLNSEQRAIVEAQEPALAVVAGPGSGKTRAIVHRIAALVKLQQVAPERILALAYNRNAVRELRLRLRGLIGPRAVGLRVHTFHGLALSLLGRAPGEVFRTTDGGQSQFDRLLTEACDMLERGDEDSALPEDEAVRRIQLLGGVEYIFVDEYQDVDALQYRLIRLVAGLSKGEETERKVQVRLCVIGDDDQNIYAFRGASHRYLLQFEREYGANRLLLVQNYRSTEPIITAANRLISHNAERCKRQPTEQVRINESRVGSSSRPVQAWQVENTVSLAARVSKRVLHWLEEQVPPQEIAILAPRWDDHGPARLLLEEAGVPTQALDRGAVRLMRNLATCMLCDALTAAAGQLFGPGVSLAQKCRDFFRRKGRSLEEPTVRTLIRIAADVDQERGAGLGEELRPVTSLELLESIHEYDEANETHRDESAVVVTTCHGAKGLEFRKVILMTDGFEPTTADVQRCGNEEAAWEEKRRLFYVAMTRAREELVMCGVGESRLVRETGVMPRLAPPLTQALPLRIVYRDMTPAEVNLGHPASRNRQKLIRTLREGDPLRLLPRAEQEGRVSTGRRWHICDVRGCVLGALSGRGNTFFQRHGLELADGEIQVGRIFRHLKLHEVSGEKIEDWFVVLPRIRLRRDSSPSQ